MGRLSPLKSYIYLVLGKSMQGHILQRACKKESERKGLCVQVEEVDILKNKDHDLTDRKVAATWMDTIRAGFYDVVLVTPPCSTFSRARCANMPGPPPLRSRSFPRGFLAFQTQQAASGTGKLFDGECGRATVGETVLLFWQHPKDLWDGYSARRGRIDSRRCWSTKGWSCSHGLSTSPVLGRPTRNPQESFPTSIA